MTTENNTIIAELPEYSVSKDGFVLNLKTNRVLKPRKSKYLSVSLCLNGKSFQKTIHRLVALNFIPNTDNKTDVNHIDGNKHNNHYTNLEWVTRSENIKHAFNNGLNAYTKELKEIRANARRGKTHSKETKENISKGLLRYNEQKKV